MMKTCISSYSFSKLTNAGAMTHFEMMDKVKELGIDALEFSTIVVPEGKTLPEYAKELKAYADKIGLPIVSYVIGANFMVEDPAVEVARLKGQVDVAEILGVKQMRHDVMYGFYEGYTGIKTFEAALPIIAPAIREVAEYAASKGIVTMSENHGYIAQDADRMLALFTAVGHPNYRWLCDIGNFVCADEDPVISVGKLLPLVQHVHVKDFFVRSGMLPAPGKGWGQTRGGNYFRGTIYGQGNMPTLQCLRLLKQAGYDRYVSLEFEGIEDTLMSIEWGMENIRRHLAMLED